MTPDTTTVSAETRPLCLPRHDPCVRNPKMTISLEACLKNGVRHNTCVRRDTTPVSDETRPLCPTRHDTCVRRDTTTVSDETNKLYIIITYTCGTFRKCYYCCSMCSSSLSLIYSCVSILHIQ